MVRLHRLSPTGIAADKPFEQATHFLLLATCLSPTGYLQCRTNEDTWITLPFPQPTNFLYIIPLPETVRAQPVAHLRYFGADSSDFIGGWGLSTTNPPPWVTYPQLLPIPDQLVQPGECVEIVPQVINPYAPPDQHKFVLLCGPPDAVLDENNGRFLWQVPTNPPVPNLTVTIKVQDDATPPMASTQQFVIRFANAFCWRTVVCSGDVWRYHDLGVELGTSWKESDYDDSAWPTGPAPLGFGNDDEATLLANGRCLKPVTTYFRKTFTLLTSPESHEVLGSLRCDDGAVVYLNGIEIFRYNLPSGLIQFDTPALTPTPPQLKHAYIPFSIPVSLLRTGLNALAVEIHRSVSTMEPEAFWSFDEPVSPWPDSMHCHDFVVVGSNIIACPGRVGGCISNSASSTSYVMTADTPSLRFSGPFTVGGWFAYGHQYGSDRASTCLEKEGEFRLYYTGYENNRYRLRVAQVEVEEQTSGTTSGQWRFVIAWYDGTNACIQMDNGPVYSVAVPVSPDPTTNPVLALRRSGVTGGFAADEVFFFKRWLDPEERYALFNIGLRNILATNEIDLSTDLELRALLPREPQFVTTLSNFMCQPGGNVQFVLEARSVFPVSYQWLFNGVPIEGATNSLLFLPAVDVMHSGWYSLVASNIGGAVTSAPAKLTVVTTPQLAIDLAPDLQGPILKFAGGHVAFQLLASSNLVDWVVLCNIPPTTNQVSIVDRTLGTAQCMFYRLRPVEPEEIPNMLELVPAQYLKLWPGLSPDGGRFVLYFTCTNAPVCLQVSTNLSEWQTVYCLPGLSGLITLLEPVHAGAPYHFYRLKVAD